ncbi:hypothetical protein AGLY_004977 [Aphis glycines]|uniref:Uncharacterized protein n=1 Tax=Aphis glycines TaxID=307491 RepID=A0A6G0TVE3_APHGL|nr:hypothetical protein AGLY_004977 [Aphis glycines]
MYIRGPHVNINRYVEDHLLGPLPNRKKHTHTCVCGGGVPTLIRMYNDGNYQCTYTYNCCFKCINFYEQYTSIIAEGNLKHISPGRIKKKKKSSRNVNKISYNNIFQVRSEGLRFLEKQNSLGLHMLFYTIRLLNRVYNRNNNNNNNNNNSNNIMLFDYNNTISNYRRNIHYT